MIILVMRIGQYFKKQKSRKKAWQKLIVVLYSIKK